MIKALEIENFKGIGERQGIEFAPITLLFGPNSAGKSTIIQALAYLHSLMTEGYIEVHRTKIGGDSIDLGGFENIRHRHELDRDLRIYIELSGGEDLPRIYGCPDDEWGITEKIRGSRFGIQIDIGWKASSKMTVVLDGIPAGTISYTASHGWIGGQVERVTSPSVAIEWLNPYHPRFLLRYEALEEQVRGVNQDRRLKGAPLVEIMPVESTSFEDEDLYCLVVEGQPLQNAPDLWSADLLGCSAIMEAIEYAWLGGDLVSHDGFLKGFRLDLAMFADLSVKGIVPVPTQNRRIQFCEDFVRIRPITRFQVDDPYDSKPEAVTEEYRDCVSVLSYLFVGVAEAVRRDLNIMFFGPLRAIPKRVESIWRSDIGSPPGAAGSGLDAWHSLFSALSREVAEINEWLTADDRIGLGIGIQRTKLLMVDEKSELGKNLSYRRDLLPVPASMKKSWGCRELVDVGEDLPRQVEIQMRDLRTGTDVMPADVGVGVSQVLPVVVWAVRNHDQHWVTCVEQPELHLHPKAQLALGDLFITTARFGEDDEKHDDERPHQWLVETHSEHVLLRLLRRIRETCSDDLDVGKFPIRPEHLAVNYIEAGLDGMRARVLEVDEDGDFAGDWPEGFFEERNEELF